MIANILELLTVLLIGITIYITEKKMELTNETELNNYIKQIKYTTRLLAMATLVLILAYNYKINKKLNELKLITKSQSIQIDSNHLRLKKLEAEK
tara:strand:+ start:357 stop:641 length:285 start_codon:yes stop_codon:yes gene_type:complete